MKDTKPLRKNPNMVTRVIEGETILLPIYKTSDEINCIYTFNKIASRIWELIDGKKTGDQISRKLLEEFDAPAEEINKETAKFIRELQGIKAIL